MNRRSDSSFQYHTPAVRALVTASRAVEGIPAVEGLAERSATNVAIAPDPDIPSSGGTPEGYPLP